MPRVGFFSVASVAFCFDNLTSTAADVTLCLELLDHTWGHLLTHDSDTLSTAGRALFDVIWIFRALKKFEIFFLQ